MLGENEEPNMIEIVAQECPKTLTCAMSMYRRRDIHILRCRLNLGEHSAVAQSTLDACTRAIKIFADRPNDLDAKYVCRARPCLEVTVTGDAPLALRAAEGCVATPTAHLHQHTGPLALPLRIGSRAGSGWAEVRTNRGTPSYRG
jgi:hypothetical protein